MKNDFHGASVSQNNTQFNFILFVLSFIIALGAAISMVVHAAHARGSGHENVYTPLLLAIVKLMKVPQLTTQYKTDKNATHLLLLVGAVVSCLIWSASVLIAATA